MCCCISKVQMFLSCNCCVAPQVKPFMQLLKQQFASTIDTLMSVYRLPVSLAAFPRVAIVVINGLQSAKDAARELHGCCMQGHTLHVEHIHKAIGESQSQASASISGSESSRDADKPRTSKTEREVRIWGG